MDSEWWTIALLVGVLVALPLLRPMLTQLLAGSIDRSALGRQADGIHLDRTEPQWRDDAWRQQVRSEFEALGFVDAGCFTIREMRGLNLLIMIHAEQGFSCFAYEHPQAGRWFEVVSRYEDGTSACYGTSLPTGLEPRPGHIAERMPGAGPSAVCQRAQRDRPRKPMLERSVETAPGDFEQAYAESLAWRKQQGLARAEVVEASMRKAA
jgi:hypothetical protein